MKYEHTHFGWVTLGSLGGGLLFCLISYFCLGYKPVFLLPAAILLVAVVLFPTLSVRLDDERLVCSFGFGLITRTIAIADIAAAEAVSNKWYWGWGIRITPRGWLWNVSGLKAVELTFQNGKHFRIGTDNPEQLAGALNQSIAHLALQPER